MLKALDHIIVAVENLDEAAKHWALLLGTKPVWASTHPEQGTANRVFNFGDFYLELIAAQGPGGFADKVKNFIAKNGEGLFGLCCASDDIEAEAKAWEAKGLTSVEIVAGEGVASDNKKREWKLLLPSLEQTAGMFIFAIKHSLEHNSLPLAEHSHAAIKNLDHIVIATSQADNIKTLLGETLGIRLALDRTNEKWNSRLLFFRLDNHKTIEVAQSLKNTDTPTGLWGLSWQTEDIDATHKRLSARGAFNLSEVRLGRKAGTKVFSVRDAPSNIATIIISKD